MNKETYKKQDITAYLLGTLPEPEAEYFDELSFTEDDFAEQLNAAEKDLIDSYINNELKADELDKFKSYYLASPLRREKVEFARSFQVLAQKEMARDAPVLTEKEKTKSFFANLWMIPSLQWGVALATLALVFLGGWVVWQNSRQIPDIGKNESNNNQSQIVPNDRETPLPDANENQQNTNSEIEKQKKKIDGNETNSPTKLEKSNPKVTPKPVLKEPTPKPKDLQPQTRQPVERELAGNPKSKSVGQGTGYASPAKIFSFFLSPPLRGNNKIPSFAIPSDTNDVVVSLQLESDDYPNYKATLQQSSDSQAIWQSWKLRSSAKGKNKLIKVSIPAELLKSQIYTLQVSGIKPDGSTEIIGDYPFRAVIK